MEIIKELAVFNNIKYYDEPHKYYINGKQMLSCTTFIHKFQEDFEANVNKPDRWAEKQGHIFHPKSMADKSAHKRNFYPMEGDPYGRPDYSKPKPKEEWVTEADVQAEWDYLNNHATFEGSCLHDFAENYLSNRIFPTPKMSPEGLHFNEIAETYKILKQQFINFYDVSVAQGKLIPVRSELVVGDEELGITGMVDQLFWNVKEQCLQIWDWKTNTVLNLINKFGNKMLYILWMLDDCEFSTYSLQLSVYKRIIERNTNLKLGDSYLVWFNEENPDYQIIKCDDYTHLVDDMFKFKLENEEIFAVA
jgi:hypothetical protein